MNIFITGSSGFSGSVFLRKISDIVSKDDKIFLLSRNDRCSNDSRIEYLIGDLENIVKYSDYLMRSDYIYHLAANASFSAKKNECDKDNFHATKKIVDLVKNSSELKNFIYISSMGAYDRSRKERLFKPIANNDKPNPKTNYGKSKLLAEKYVKNNLEAWTIIRPGWIYGVGMRTNSHIHFFLELIKKKSFLTRFRFPGSVSIIHVDDFAYSLCNCIENPNVVCKEYFASSEIVTFQELFCKLYSQYWGTSLKQMKIPTFASLFIRFHSIIPLSLNILFLDYLTIDNNDYLNDLLLGNEILTLNMGIQQLVNSSKKKWIITGANSGIGLALAELLHQNKKQLILIDKNTDNLEHLKKNHIVYILDLENKLEIDECVNRISSYNVECLINNAGLGFKGDMSTLEWNMMKKMVDVNILATLYLTKKLLPFLQRDHSAIANIASSSAYYPLPGMSIYSSSKAFILNWSLALSYELQKKVHVTTVSPSGTLTNFQNDAGVKTQKKQQLLSPDYVAKKILSSVAKKKKHVIIGNNGKILFLLSKIMSMSNKAAFFGFLFEKSR